MATASPTSTSRKLIAFHSRAGRAGHRHGGAAARPLRRDQLGRPARHRLPGEAARRRRLDQRRLLRAARPRSATTSTATPRYGSASRWSKLAADGQLARILHDGFWQPMDTLRDQPAARGAVGRRHAPRGRYGNEKIHDILITGNQGYVGPVLGRHLRRVFPGRAADRLRHRLFRALHDGRRGSGPSAARRAIQRRRARHRRLVCSHGVDAVVALAAISNDPDGRELRGVTDADQSRRRRAARGAGGRGAASGISSSPPRAASMASRPAAPQARERSAQSRRPPMRARRSRPSARCAAMDCRRT